MADDMKSDYNLGLVLRITIPLILTSLSATAMMAADRYIVGLFSIQSMNAISIVGSYICIPTMFFSVIAAISTVFVGQFNGNQQYKKIGLSVWQMIYLSILVGIISIPFVIWPDVICFLPDMYHSEGLPYQQILTYNVFFVTFFSAISGFFIGRGKTALVTIVVVFTNLINLILDIILVFGLQGVVRSMGVVGAAIATDVSFIIGDIMLFFIFLSPRNRRKYATLNRKFDKNIFLGCLKIGGPAAIERVFNLSAWSFIVILLGSISDDLATLEAVTVTVYLLFYCYTEGLNKGAAAIAANLIGQNRIEKVESVFRTYLKINAIFTLVISIPLVLWQDLLFFFLNKMNGNISHLHGEFSFVFYVLFIIIFLDGIFWIIYGILAAGGDTLWAAVVNTVLAWVLIALPTYLMYITGTLTSVREFNLLSALTSLIVSIVIYVRYKKGSWLKKCHIVD